MKRESQRLLSGILSLSLCLGLASPAALAADPEKNDALRVKAPISAHFTASGDWDPESASPGRVWLDVAGNDTVVDSFTYTVASNQDASSADGEKAADRYSVDEYGYITLKSGKSAIPGEELTVTAHVNYFDGDDVIWADNVLNDTLDMYTQGKDTKNLWSYSISGSGSKQVARTGQYGITTGNDGWNAAPKNVEVIPDHKSTPVTVTAWYFDPVTDEELAYAETEKPSGTPYQSMEGQLGIYLNGTGETGAATCFMGTAYVSATNPKYNPGNYCLRGGNDGKAYSFGAEERSEGWHKLVWTVSSSGTAMTVSKLNKDGTLTEEGTTSSSHITTANGVTSISIANNKGNAAYSDLFIHNKHFLDDISVVKTDAISQSITTTVKITVAGDAPEPPAPAAPVSAILLGGETLTPGGAAADKIRLDTAAAPGYVIDEITGYSYDTAKITIDENGRVKIKDGYTPTETETIPVTVSYQYYGGSDVKYVENFDNNKATPFSNSKGINYAINDGQSHTGRYGVTPHGTTGDAAIASVGNFTDVRVTAWYFDPYDTTDKAFDGKYTMKYGFAATSTSGGDVNTNQLGVFSGTSAGDGSQTHYAYRTGTSGNFAASTVERTSGWKKMEWLITDSGTEISIGGATVATVADRKSVANLVLATNWCGQNAADQAGMALLRGRHFIDDISIVAASAAPTETSTVVNVTIAPDELPPEPALTFGADNSGSLNKGESGRVYLDNTGGYAIKSVEYTTNNPNITVSGDGTLEVKAGYAPKANEKVTVTAKVTYYNNTDDVIFADSFEGEKTFTKADAAAYQHSGVNALFGRHAATAGGSTKGYPEYALSNPVSDVTVTAWYYDTNGRESQVKFGFSPNGGNNALGVVYDGDIAKLVNDLTYDNYAARIPGVTYHNYAWGTTDAPRSEGWHKFEWIIDGTNGMTIKVDNEVVSTNSAVGDGKGSNVATNHELVKAENISSVKQLTKLTIQAGWNNNATNLGAIMDKHFIDGVTVVKNTATTDVKTLTSIAIPVLDTQYTHTPTDVAVDSTYPSDLTVMVKPGLEELESVAVDSTVLDSAVWSKYLDNGPTNASYYPADMKGWKLTVDGAAIKAVNLSDGAHKLVLTMSSGSTYEIPFTAAANTHVAKSYYLSNSGDDNKLGTSAAEAWASFQKLGTVTFGPGDKIYLDATSFWNGVQFRPKGSGAPGAPIVMSKYNDGGDPSKRPILNGDGTVSNKTDYKYLAFEAWRKFYPSGAIELFGVEHWEVRGLEITNYKATYEQGATGRNGIAVIYDYFEMGPEKLSALPSGDKAKEEAFYRAGKLRHIVIEDNYIHDVTGYHPGSGASGAGGKMSGGINAYGPYDDLKLDNNIIMYCDVEGIRNDVLAWRGDTRTQFPAYMEDVSISNNFIVGVPGDGVVISSADEPRLANNYLADAGYSYHVTKAGKTVTEAKPMSNRDNPIIVDNATNFAGLWFIGTKNAVAEYNESVNNVWTCNDGEAFDADMFTWGTIFQYNYTYRNNGGFCLFMSGNQMDEGTLVRYNVSIEDGEGVGTPNDGRKATFHYNKEPDAIYNNLFVLGSGVRSMFGGDSDIAYFYNNMVIKPNGQIGDFNLNTVSNGNANATDMTGGEMKNNLFYPAAILNNVTGSITKADNITPDSLDGIFYDLTSFLDLQPVHALIGRSALTGTPVNMTDGTGAGVAMSGGAGRKVAAPAGTGFDYVQFEGIKTVEGAVTIGAGIPVTHAYPGNDSVNPLSTDFFKNSLNGVTTPDIGPYQWSADASHFVKLAYEGNGATVAAETVKAGATHTLPAPTKVGYVFEGWYTDAALTNKAAASYTVPAAGITLYAKWTERAPNTYDVTFDAQGGSTIAPIIGVAKDSKITAPAAPTKAHYEFKGWYKESACTNAWDFGIDTVTDNLTLFAKWEGETFTVTFDKNGGDIEATPATKTITYPSTTVDELPMAPTKAGFTFVGWTTAQNGDTFFGIGTTVTQNITVYAKWIQNTENTYNVVFDTQGGSIVAPITGVAKGEKIVAPAAPAKAHYEFKGWYKESACINAWDFEVDTITAETTLYAKWEGEVFTVTFDKNGGDTEAIPAAKTVIYPSTTVDALPAAPTKADNTFMGWTTTPNGNSYFDAVTTITGSITVYAKWEVSDNLVIAAAKALVEGATYTVTQANAITEATVRARLVAMVEALELNGVSALIKKVSYTAAISGTERNPSGTNGSYVFTVTLSKGVGTPAATGTLTMVITATPYTAPAPAPSGGGSSYQPVVKENEVEGGKVSATTNRDGSTSYRFKPEKGMELKYIRVNGLSVSITDKLTLPKGSTAAVVAVFMPTGEDPLAKFDDVAGLSGQTKQAVSYVVGAGLFGGTGADTFAPEMGMNRAMFATVLARLYGADTTAFAESGFSDVSGDVWYGSSVLWAAQKGYVQGVGGASFAPEQNLTRQELVTLVYRFAKDVGVDVSTQGDLGGYADLAELAGWSADAMGWAVSAGLITGRSGGLLAPNAQISRAETAVILERMANLLTAKVS